ncbi:MAG TPA: amidophosphoribosyltransferase [Candidatus Thermoplasmatota archaeon]|nr:amidophosphoribosyltransferase [Candidatus Thermoplasmatota archaeon]
MHAREADGDEVFVDELEADRAPIRDHCGVAGLAAQGLSSAPPLYAMLRALQHRGQESAGITVIRKGGAATHKAMGLVENVFPREILNEPDSGVGIGHVRYSTTGGSFLENAQPVVVSSSAGDVAIAHNGDIVNSGQLREELKAKGWSFLTTNDTEVAVRLLANELAHTENRVKAIRNVVRRLTGSFSLVILVGGALFAVRDPLGIKPLCVGKLAGGAGHVVASESTALNAIGADLVRDVEPGEILEIAPEKIVPHPLGHRDEAAHCMFEYVYFARADSVIDQRPVYDVRHRIGHALATEAPADADIVVPVPDSGRTHALGYAAKSGLPFVEGLMKNRYVHRTFIMPDQKDRDQSVRMKLNPVRSQIQGKRVVLLDDSIVRGTTMRRIVAMLRDAGAREVHVRIGSPPIIAPCYLGIDMNTRQQLVAAEHPIAEIQKLIGADSLAYLSLDGLVKAIDLPRRDLCMGCLTGAYPVEIPGEQHRRQQRLF